MHFIDSVYCVTRYIVPRDTTTRTTTVPCWCIKCTRDPNNSSTWLALVYPSTTRWMMMSPLDAECCRTPTTRAALDVELEEWSFSLSPPTRGRFSTHSGLPQTDPQQHHSCHFAVLWYYSWSTSNVFVAFIMQTIASQWTWDALGN